MLLFGLLTGVPGVVVNGDPLLLRRQTLMIPILNRDASQAAVSDSRPLTLELR